MEPVQGHNGTAQVPFSGYMQEDVIYEYSNVILPEPAWKRL